jgi:hypothetical protein
MQREWLGTKTNTNMEVGRPSFFCYSQLTMGSNKELVLFRKSSFYMPIIEDERKRKEGESRREE